MFVQMLKNGSFSDSSNIEIISQVLQVVWIRISVLSSMGLKIFDCIYFMKVFASDSSELPMFSYECHSK